MLMVQGHSGWMLMTLRCSDLQHREAHGTGVQPAVWGCDFPGRGDGMRVCDTGPAERGVLPSVSGKEVDLQLQICASCTATKPCSGGAVLWLPWVDKTGGGSQQKNFWSLTPM